MTQAPQKIKVFIATGDAGQVHDLTALLNAEEDVEVVGLAAGARDALAALAAARTDVVVVDLHLPDADGIETTEAITAQFPWVSPILVSSNADPNVLRRAMLAGARHFLIRPFPAQDLLDAVREVFVRDAARRASQAAPLVPPPAADVPSAAAAAADKSPSRQGKIYTFYSAKGGVGCTTLACNLAVTLKQRTGKEVALFDCGLLFGDVGVVLNLNPRHTIIDVLPHIQPGPRGLDADVLGQMMVSHASGVKVLLAPPSPEKADLVTPDHIRHILTTLRDQFDYVVIDTWPTFEERILHVLDNSDKIVVPTTIEMPAIKNSKLLLDVTGALSYPPEKIMMVLNRADSRGGIRVQDVEQILGRSFAAEIVSDGQVTTHSLNEGVPFVVSHPTTTITANVADLTRKLAGLTAPAPAEVRARRSGLFRGMLGFAS